MSAGVFMKSIALILLLVTGTGWAQTDDDRYSPEGYYIGEKVDQPPKLLYKEEPHYSEEARRAGIEGTVYLTAIVEKDGRAHDIRIQRGLGLGLNRNAIRAVREWRFRPGMRDGEYVRVRCNFRINYRLVHYR